MLPSKKKSNSNDGTPLLRPYLQSSQHGLNYRSPWTPTPQHTPHQDRKRDPGGLSQVFRRPLIASLRLGRGI
ncbi:hypothetical protein E2C01_015682 [Portunus trituberculatus]|uniref:Uncharacterized protein n=1 Tax=Portunus trituberculatus TaxID=210409 RepID=A0A5B7DM85_PORTR|nr:hypothetical protein [Portunus trituberculatus]